MSEPINMVEFVKAVPSRPRGRACIVFTHEHAGQKQWASELARQTGSAHIDLLNEFIRDTESSSMIGQSSVSCLFGFLKGYSSKPVLIISNMEFLKAAWSGQSNAGEQFARRVETWSQKPCLLFVMQYDKVLANRKFGRFPQHIFIIDQKETLAL